MKYWYDVQAWLPKNMVIVNLDAWNSLDEKTQGIVLEAAAKAEKNGWTMPQREHVHMPGLCLNPAACFPCYPTLEGHRLNGPARRLPGRAGSSGTSPATWRAWTGCGSSTSASWFFVGSEKYVATCRKRALPLIGELASTFDLDCSVETATDPFFATVAAAKKFWQQAQEVKNEIMLWIEPHPDGSERRIAGGSVNLHGNFFGSRFNIEAENDEPAHTGCIGLGVERWVLAAFSQHGFDPSRWLADVRDRIFG